MTSTHLLILVGLIYGSLVVSVLGHLRKRRPFLLDAAFTSEDRQLVGATVFYMLLPAVLLIGLLAQLVHALAFGLDIELRYFIYWGYVVAETGPAADRLVSALVSPITTVAIALGLVRWTRQQPRGAFENFVRLELARLLFWFSLLIHPALSLIFEAGSAWSLRRELNAMQPSVGDVVLLAGLALAALVWRAWRRKWRGAFLWRTTQLWDRRRAAEEALALNPEDLAALRELASVYLLADETDNAITFLSRAIGLAPEEPRTRFLAGVAHLRAGQPAPASEHLCVAGSVLEESGPSHAEYDLYFEVTLGLAAARLGLGDHEGAMLTVEAAEEQRPREPRVELMFADVLVASDRADEARSRLSRALQFASDRTFTREIKRRLKMLG